MTARQHEVPVQGRPPVRVQEKRRGENQEEIPRQSPGELGGGRQGRRLPLARQTSPSAALLFSSSAACFFVLEGERSEARGDAGDLREPIPIPSRFSP